MNLNRVQKIILGVFTFLPFLLIPIFLWQIFHSIGEAVFLSDHHDPDAEEIIMPLLAFIIPMILTALGAFALMIFYIIHVVLNKTLEGGEQVLWILLFIFIGIFAFPAYWILRIWNNPNKS